MSLYRIVGIDPGLRTGVTAFTLSEDEIRNVESYELDLVGVGHFLDLNHYHCLAYEVANKFQASGHVSSEVIGLVKYFAAIKDKDIVPVTQSSHKRLITRDVLKRAGLYVNGVHAKDAAGVGLFVAVTKYKLLTNVLRQEDS